MSETLEDFALAIFLYTFRKPSHIKDAAAYPKHLIYSYGITDPVAYHCKLISEGYFIRTYATPFEFKLSEKGREYLSKHEDYVFLHLHPELRITPDEYMSIKNKYPHSAFDDLRWRLYNAQKIDSRNKQKT